MNRIEGTSISGQAGQFGLGSGSARDSATQAQTGTFRGERVMVKDAASALADAAEEISMHNSENVEKKTFGERACKAESSIDIQKIEDISAYLDAAKCFDDPKKLADLAKRMQSGQEHPGELARQQTRDPAQQFMLLQYALVDGERAGAAAEGLNDIRDALAELEMNSGPQIRAGLNTMGVAAGQSDSAQGIATFQGTYRDVVLGDSSLSQTLKLVLDRLGGPQGEDLAKGLQGMIKALGSDLSAARPSIDGNRLHALVQDLYQLEVAVTVMDNCRELAAKLAQDHATPGLQPMALMHEMIAVTGEKWVSAPRFTGMAEKQGVRAVDAQITFHMATKVMLRELPPKVFSDPDSRQSILSAAQDALDAAIDKEEENL